ncbi:MAG: class I SAM-dependent methyltransferase [Limnospira sp. PMC 1291.21]|uniref:Methyltransferase type 11 n=1 Tax=Limnospira maxima CS-328 TaxID=513049 RepID=B5W2P3_LIMMA|nr:MULTISPECIES: class I SAM-dependent methyltransferase [Limnospira]EKD06568.1 methyltransferase type 11 [Arthrospira platensis C1]MDC0839652.1 class I SAM-dependent methyltransferase [Limnoraphis robusta]MDY7054046.1 class I SAM-dependent methyltransferase [Limnospira fusiformis LS22]EDZ94167.1 Methyltransferase type 11 [Limnospira maxima CS-328]MDT9178478.1 class I SAM-dependent methyltransferase [Limnospira sp. PMC 1238.20]
MMNEIFWEIHRDLLRESPGGDEYTRQGFRMLPSLSQRKILDIGCGPGSSTLELARLTDGEITAIDIHQPYLESLKQKAIAEGFGERITCLNQSMSSLNFPPSSFDIIWAEGSIYIMGFETGLKQLKSYLKSGGYMMVSELVWLRDNPPSEVYDFWQADYPAMKNLWELSEIIANCGYEIINQFTLPERGWLNYYNPLEERINHLYRIYQDNQEGLKILDMEKREVEIYREYHEWYGYEFFILHNP